MKYFVKVMNNLGVKVTPTTYKGVNGVAMSNTKINRQKAIKYINTHPQMRINYSGHKHNNMLIYIKN